VITSFKQICCPMCIILPETHSLHKRRIRFSLIILVGLTHSHSDLFKTVTRNNWFELLMIIRILDRRVHIAQIRSMFEWREYWMTTLSDFSPFNLKRNITNTCLDLVVLFIVSYWSAKNTNSHISFRWLNVVLLYLLVY